MHLFNNRLCFKSETNDQMSLKNQDKNEESGSLQVPSYCQNFANFAKAPPSFEYFCTNCDPSVKAPTLPIQ